MSLAEQPPPTHAPEKLKMVLVARADLGMSTGKIAAQCVHAALAAYRQALAQVPRFVRAWESQGEATICLQCSGDEELQVMQHGARWFWMARLMPVSQALIAAAKQQNIVAEDICDAGRTEVASGTRTVAAFGPAPCSAIDCITGKLRLMK